MTQEASEPVAAVTLAAIVDGAAEQAEHEYEIARRLREELNVRSDHDERDGALSDQAFWTFLAYEYHLSGPNPAELAYFQPPLLYADGSGNIPQLSSLTDEAVEWLEELSTGLKHPRARARLEHLLFLRRSGKPGEHARAAIESYLAIAQGSIDIDAADAVRTALELAHRISDQGLRDRAVDVMTQVVWDALSSDQPSADVVFQLLRTLAIQTLAPDISQLVAEARRIYAVNVHHLDTIVELELQRSSGDAVTQAKLWAERVNLWMTVADQTNRLVGSNYLRRAVEHARASGIADLLERATAKLQELRLNDLGLTRLQVGMSLPRPDLEALISPITKAPTWQEALLAFARLGPVTGDADENLATTRQQQVDFPLSRLFPPQQLGSDNLPRFSATTDEEIFEYQRVKNETLYLQLRTPMVLEALIRIVADRPIPTLEELTSHFAANPIVPVPLAGALARSFLRFWAGDPEGAVFSIAPRIEALARNLLVHADVGIYRLQREQSPGQYPGLRFLLDELSKRGLDPSWHRFLLVLCAHVAGLNARNELLHGFVDDVGDDIAALLLQVAAHLAILNISAGEGSTAPSPGSD